MRCEVCGREIRGPPFRRVIESAKMMVCEQCASFGDEEWSQAKPRQPPMERPARRSEFESLERVQLSANYGEMIREARQHANLTVEALAKKLGEKESVVKNLEREELVPSEDIIRKVRNVLKINLLVPVEPTSVPKSSKPAGDRALGDMIKLKTSSKEKPKANEEPEEG